MAKGALKDLERVPKHITLKLDLWIRRVEEVGVEAVRTVKSYHDEPLKGNLRGCRSIRLNRSYRAIYAIRFEVIVVEEVTKHGY